MPEIRKSGLPTVSTKPKTRHQPKNRLTSDSNPTGEISGLAAVSGENKHLREFLQEIAATYTPAERELAMKAVFLVGLADGVFRNAEEAMLSETAQLLGISGERLYEIVEETLTLGEEE